jgi:hypothetical protein
MAPWSRSAFNSRRLLPAKSEKELTFSIESRGCGYICLIILQMEVIMRKLIFFLAKPLCFLLIVSYSLLDLSVQSARAGLIGTETVMNAGADQKARTQVTEFLGRQEVQQALSRQGIDPAEAKDRVASLSEKEVARVAKMLDRLPAGGDTGTVVGVALLVFFILLISDILGYTNIFGFVRGSSR